MASTTNTNATKCVHGKSLRKACAKCAVPARARVTWSDDDTVRVDLPSGAYVVIHHPDLVPLRSADLDLPWDTAGSPAVGRAMRKVVNKALHTLGF